MKDLSKTELLIMKCVWGSDRPVTATQIQQILLEKYQTELDRRSLGTLMYRLDQKGYVNVDVSTRVNLYTAKVKEEEARKEFAIRVRSLKTIGLTENRFYEWRFENDNGNNPKLNLARKYVKDWKEMQ